MKKSPSPDAPPKRKRWDAVLDRIDPERAVRGVEVGVWRGILSRRLLAERPRLHLTLVDPWMTGEPGTPWWESGSVMPARPQPLYDAALARTTEVTEFAADRREIVRASSVDAAAEMARLGVRLDFVFIDGDHSYEGVVADILAWLPLIKVGGWIGGHDWDRPDRGRVTEAVRDCFPDREIEVDAESTWFLRVRRGMRAVNPFAAEAADEVTESKTE